MISVIVPAYNAAHYLEDTIKSVQAQTYENWELIIVDDGSKDATFAVARSHSEKDSRVKAFSQKNAGVSVARNYGFSKTQPGYPYALFLDSDDMLVPEALEKLLSVLERQPETPAACGLVQEVDSTGRALETSAYFETILNRRGIVGNRLVRRDPASGVSFGDMSFHNYITTPGTVLIKKSIFDTPIIFDPQQGYTADWDIWWRVTLKAGPVAVVPETVLLYRIHSSSMSQNHAAARQGVYAFQQKMLIYPGLSEEQKQTARLGYFYHSLAYGEYASHYFRKGQIEMGIKHLGLAIRDLLRFSKNVLFPQGRLSAGKAASEGNFG